MSVISHTRAERHRAILTLIAAAPVQSQTRLSELLAKQGHTVNQGTLSRDLRELGVLKGPDGYTLPGHAAPTDPLSQAIHNWLLEAIPASNQLVLKTPPGCAQPLALAIDQKAPDGAIGTIAGDDTILVICDSARAASNLAKTLLSAHPPL